MNIRHDAFIGGQADQPGSQYIPVIQRKTSPATFFGWSNANELGHDEIDAQHKRLFVLGEAIVEPLSKSPEPERGAVLLQTLIDFAEEHFAFEQRLMRTTGYPGADQHAKYHTALLTELRTYCFKVRRRLNNNPVGLINFLWNWFTIEIDSADREFVVWLKSSN